MLGIQKLSSRENSFDFLRLTAALAVLVSHHFPLSGKPEPIIPIFNDTLGGVAVEIFFVMSGFLIYNSLIRNSNWASFFSARILRLMPNLLVALVFTSILMLLWFDNFSNINAHIDYITRNFFMFFNGVVYQIPGVLEGRPNQSVNGSLWTLPYEFWMYTVLFGAFCFKPIFRVVLCIALIALFGYLAINGRWDETFQFFNVYPSTAATGKLGLQFFSGAIIAILWPYLFEKKRVDYHLVVTVLGLVMTIYMIPSVLFSISVAMLIIYIAMLKAFSFFSKVGDCSYGVYIFAFPVQQISILAIDGFYLSMVTSVFVTILMGYCSWHLYEKRMMRFRFSLARVLMLPFSTFNEVRKKPIA